MKTKKEIAVQEYIHQLKKFKRNPLKQEQLVEELSLIRKQLNVPSKFYKFRTCSKLNLQALGSNCIWMPLAETFTDISDCRVPIELNIEDIELKRINTKSGYLSCLNMVLNSFEGTPLDFTPLTIADVKQIIEFTKKDSREITIENHREILSNILLPIAEKDFFEITEFMYSAYLKNLQKSPIQTIASPLTRSFFRIYSVTTTMDNHLLWENYANHYTGFCIEYAIHEGTYMEDDFLKNTFPVIYKKKIPAFHPELDTPERFLIHMLYKHSDYKFEHEWRIVDIGTESSLEPFPYVSAIIAGKDIAQRNYARLRNIAAKLKVPLLKQAFDDRKNKFQYIQS